MAVRVRSGHAVGSNSWTRAMTCSVLALLATAAMPVSSGAAAAAGSPDGRVSGVGAPPIATAPTCADETVRWGGFQVLDAAIPSFDTGVDVVAQSGTTLTVVGVSADGLDPTDHAHAMPVYVGGVRALPGASVDGGDVIVSTDGTVVLRAAGVTVVVRRCAEVAVAGPAPAVETAAVTATTRTDVATSATEPASAAWPTAEAAAAVVSTLPATGRDSWPNTVVGGLLVAIGAALVTFGRRPRHGTR